jgi:hypothetical protein
MRKHPMKVNVYDFMRTANSALAPMFPYQEPGSIVPCVTAFRGAQDRTFGAFQHFNTVDEVMINFGSHGAAPRPGMVAVGAQLHQVSIRMTDPNDDNACQLNVITQRQAEAGEDQHERVTFFCVKCQASLVEHAYQAQPSEELRDRFTAGETGPLGTLIESARAVQRRRRCAQMYAVRARQRSIPARQLGLEQVRRVEPDRSRHVSQLHVSLHAGREEVARGT